MRRGKSGEAKVGISRPLPSFRGTAKRVLINGDVSVSKTFEMRTAATEDGEILRSNAALTTAYGGSWRELYGPTTDVDTSAVVLPSRAPHPKIRFPLYAATPGIGEPEKNGVATSRASPFVVRARSIPRFASRLTVSERVVWIFVVSPR